MPSPSNAEPAATGCSAVRRARPLLGTLVEIAAAADVPCAELHQAVARAFAAIEQVERLMSYHDPDSELSRLNREAAVRPQPMHRDTCAVLRTALRFAARSGGAFDPCIAPSLEAWGLLPRHGTADVDPAASWRDVEILDGSRVRFKQPLRLDLGGIAKGYAVDQAVRALQRAGVRSVLVNAGGDLRVAGEGEETIGLRNPQRPALIAHTIKLRGAALATSSACYSRCRAADAEVSALLDPLSRAPYLGGGSVSVRAADCMSADALTKIVLFAHPRVAARVLEESRAEALVLQAESADSGLAPRDRRVRPGVFRVARAPG